MHLLNSCEGISLKHTSDSKVISTLGQQRNTFCNPSIIVRDKVSHITISEFNKYF